MSKSGLETSKLLMAYPWKLKKKKLSLYVDLNKRKVVEFDPDRLTLMDNFMKKNSPKFNSEKLIFLNKLKKA